MLLAYLDIIGDLETDFLSFLAWLGKYFEKPWQKIYKLLRTACSIFSDENSLIWFGILYNADAICKVQTRKVENTKSHTIIVLFSTSLPDFSKK